MIEVEDTWLALLLISHHILAKATRFCASGISSVRAYAPLSLFHRPLLVAAIWRHESKKKRGKTLTTPRCGDSVLGIGWVPLPD